jgi:hypothetical protein
VGVGAGQDLRRHVVDGPVHAGHGRGCGPDVGEAEIDKETRNTPFCPSHEKLHTVVLPGLRNISEAPQNPPMKFLL